MDFASGTSEHSFVTRPAHVSVAGRGYSFPVCSILGCYGAVVGSPPAAARKQRSPS